MTQGLRSRWSALGLCAALLWQGCASAPRTFGPAAEAPSPAAAPTAPAADTAAAQREQARARALAAERNAANVYRRWGTNPTVDVALDPRCDFGADLDTASAAAVGTALRSGVLPQAETVRTQEVLNSVRHGWSPSPTQALAVSVEVFPSPNRVGYHVIVIGLRARDVPQAARPPVHVVWLVDVSVSNTRGDRLQRLRQALRAQWSALRPDDRVSLVVFSDAARVLLSDRAAAERAAIEDALGALRAEGASNVGAGLTVAWDEARRVAAPVTRVMLLSDGHSSGTTDVTALLPSALPGDGALVAVALGPSGINDALLSDLAARGGGRNLRVDDADDARRALVERGASLFTTVARDVKLSVDFDPAGVSRYRLLGYENRAVEVDGLTERQVEGASLGAGDEMTALLEVKLMPGARHLGTLQVMGEGIHQTLTLDDTHVRASMAEGSPAARSAWLAAAVGEKLRGSYWVRNLSWAALEREARALPASARKGEDVARLLGWIAAARALDRGPDPFEELQPVATMDFDSLPGEPR